MARAAEPARLRAAIREARADAAPFALSAAAILVALALAAEHAHWRYLGHPLWWMWLIVAAPYVCLWATLLLGLNHLVRHDYRRAIVIGLLALVMVLNLVGVVVLVASLVAHSASHIKGSQLLASGGAVWFSDAIAFGLAFWELDCGGPVARALATGARKPDFQFPQDENPQLARDGWAPALGLLLRLADECDGVQPDRCDAAHPSGQGVDGLRVHSFCPHRAPRRGARGEHPVDGHFDRCTCSHARTVSPGPTYAVSFPGPQPILSWPGPA